jgi:hypothetical protein
MLPRTSLLDELRKGGYEASLITTYNAYLSFYEDVVLRRLINAGVRHNVLLMDAQQYSASMVSHPPRLAGRRYTLLPVKVPGAFHPKLIFLAGKHKGLVVVGSHNMTLAGFGFNRELTNVVRIQGTDDSDGIGIAQSAWTEIEHWLGHFADGVPKQVASMVRRVRDFAPWMRANGTESADSRLLSGRPGAPSLWEQLTALLDDEVDDVTVGGAFFDQKLGFLHRVNEDLRPARLIVGIDPATVQIPSSARKNSDISLVRADNLGVDTEKDEEGRGYLHAKGILLHQRNGGAIFASGSANPSTPAWLAELANGNVEMILVHRGETVMRTAELLGYSALAEMPALNESDWQTIERNQADRIESQAPPYRTGIAVVEDDRVLFDPRLLETVFNPAFALIGADGSAMATSNNVTRDGEHAIVTFPGANLDEATGVDCHQVYELVLQLLLHHAQAVEEQARTGVQRRFKDALLSLETDTPNIALLIDCIDKIVFSGDQSTATAAIRAVRKREKDDEMEAKELGSLAIDVSDVKKRKSKQRLTHSGDFAYLLDALIYHLRVQEDRSIEEVDRYGRSEEEQVGADDEEETDGSRATLPDHQELLRLCHSKVRTVVNRMASQIKAYQEGKQRLDQVLIRLLGVLAVLRELRACDARAPWVERGETTVPKEQRLRLLEEVMLNLFEGDASLLHLEPIGSDFATSDDIARLKGLVLWLAWDCGLTLNLQKPFNEHTDELNERLHRNAMVLALAQMMQSDEVVIDEARQSIGSLTTTELDWLKEVQALSIRCEAVLKGNVPLEPAEAAEPGDIAMHRKLPRWDLRVVASSNGRNVSLIRLSREKDRAVFTPEHLAVRRLS